MVMAYLKFASLTTTVLYADCIYDCAVVEAHARDELNIDVKELANPGQVALAHIKYTLRVCISSTKFLVALA